MATDGITSFTHRHDFLGEDHHRNERKVWLVIALTTTMMVVEIVAGTLYGSMALVADGWHMSTHAGAMLIAAFAYLYARRHARDPRFAFGTGKLGDLGGFASAIVLALIALLIGGESALRLADPAPIRFEQAIAVAIVGLVVNLVSAWLLHDGHGHHHGHEHHGHHAHHDHDHHDHDHAPHARDNNLRAAYLHVLADALTSVLAVVALLLGSTYGWLWADPAMGIVGAVVIARWSWSLMRDAGAVLLDRTPDGGDLPGRIRAEIEAGGDRITDLHVWQVGPGHHAAIIALVSPTPREPSHYRAKLTLIEGLSHITIEVEPARAPA